MKKTISFILIISIAILLVFSLCACGGEDKIVGTWKTEDPITGNVKESIVTALSIQINKDGTVSYISAKDKSTYDSWKWVYNKNEKAYQFTSHNGSIAYGTVTQNTLTLYTRENNDSGTKTIYRNLVFTKQ
ncbi:MAG: hypothetical protein IJ676_05800 [Clostridia bacterium]|nr:hypothetical protein [Clostridia bacterium]